MLVGWGDEVVVVVELTKWVDFQKKKEEEEEELYSREI
jgi:hypothetical protein